MSPPSNRRITKELEHIIEDIMKQRAEIEKYRQWVRETPVKPRSESDLEGLTSFFGMLRNAIEDQIMGRIVKYEKHLDAKDGYINLLIENGASRVAAEWRYRLDGRLNQVYGAVQQCHGEMENVLGVKEHRGKERHSPDTKSRTQQKDKKTKIKKIIQINLKERLPANILHPKEAAALPIRPRLGKKQTRIVLIPDIKAIQQIQPRRERLVPRTGHLILRPEHRALEPQDLLHQQLATIHLREDHPTDSETTTLTELDRDRGTTTCPQQTRREKHEPGTKHCRVTATPREQAKD
ncbi:hypothetical protein LTR64_003852 [Lithohypha guttulata]|uniref:uncharacterized protein n=1 Tax=Lithohypha guttulata TaxID=1690604 RepID=UPI002DDE363C|nr:hypothetical protein LTR51_006890 [Lithohypha guttulata]